MDPLSAATSVLTIVIAIERLRRLISKAKLILRASEEIDALLIELQSLSLVLQAMSRRRPIEEGYEDEVPRPLENCENIVAEIENVIGSVFDDHWAVCVSPLQLQYFRIRRVKRRKQIEVLAQRLEKAKATLGLQQLVSNLSCPGLSSTSDPFPASLIKKELGDCNIHPAGSSISTMSRDVHLCTTKDWKWRREAGSEPFHQVHDFLVSCQESRNVNALLGAVVVRRVSSTLCLELCTDRCCKTAIGELALMNSGRLSASMQFPRVISPDCSFVKAIRIGDLEQIKAILCAGQASVADIIVPYGLTPLYLATLYGQQTICELLIKEGALLYAPGHTWTTKDMLDFFTGHSLCDSSMSAGEIVQDVLRMSSTTICISSLWQCLSKWNGAFGALPRLHKSILGLTLESIEELAPVSRHCVNDLDGTTRTALYWATHFQDMKSMQTLLLCGADPNLGDGDGATPLHIAACIGFCAGIKLLLAAGAEIESRDWIATTPLYRAAIEGKLNALGLLLDAGADPCALNFLGETPISYATYAEQSEAIQVLRNKGCPLENVDIWGYTTILDCTFMDCQYLLSDFPFNEVSHTARIHNGKSLLHIAALNFNLGTIEILQNARLRGIEVYAVDNAGFTAMEYLRKRRDFEDMFEPFCALIVSIVSASLIWKVMRMYWWRNVSLVRSQF